MKSLRNVLRMKVEHYKCVQCEIDFPEEKVDTTWKCPHCGSYISIYGQDADSQNRITLYRMAAKDVEVGDLVYHPGRLQGSPYKLLGVNPRGKYLGFGLEGFGEHKFDPEACVNIRTGAW